MTESERPKIVLADLVVDYPAVALEALEASGIPYVDAHTAGGAPLDWIREAEVLLVTWYQVTAQVIEQLRRCKAGPAHLNSLQRVSATCIGSIESVAHLENSSIDRSL